MRVIVVGGGIGGLALAAGLAGEADVVVLERSSELRAAGGAVTIFPNGVAALEALGVDVTAVGAPVRAMRMHRADGSPLMTVDLLDLHRRTGYPVRNIARTELVGLIHDRAPAGVVRFGTAVTGVETDHTTACALTADGECVAGDLVVGADGTASTVRRHVVDAPPARPSGWMTVQSLLDGPPPEPVAQGCGVSFVGPAGFCAVMPAGARMQWWCDVRVPPEGWRTVDVPWLRRNFRGYAPLVGAMLERVGEPNYFAHRTHAVLDEWGQGPTTLLGDAAHAVPPTAGQGANQAAEDAWTLREALRAEDDVVRAVRRYEQHRAPRVRRMSRLAAAERTNQVPGPVAGLLMRRLPARLTGAGLAMQMRGWSSVLSRSRP